AISAELTLQREHLGFELDPVGAGDIGPHVHGLRASPVRVTKLEHDFGIAHWKAIDVADPPPRDECMAMEPHVTCVAEDDLPDPGPSPGGAVGESHIER